MACKMSRETGGEMEYVSVRDAARSLGISEHAVRQRAYRDSLPSRREGDRLLIGISHIQDTEMSHETSREMPDEIPQATPSTEGEPLIATVTATLALLHDQLATKDEQIATLNRTVDEMRRDHARAEEEWRVLLQTSQRLIPAVVPDAPATLHRSEDDLPPPPPDAPHRGVQQAQRPSERQGVRGWLAHLLGWE